jgi:hypothetical protein
MALGGSSQAIAQYSATFIPSVIGNTVGSIMAGEAACQAGKGGKDKVTERERAKVSVAFNDYLRRAGASRTADATPVFTKKAKLRIWQHDDTAGDPASLDDPLAHSLAPAEAPAASLHPEGFVLSGDRTAALGTWRVAAAGTNDGATLGWYRALFRYEYFASGPMEWKLQRLELTSGATAPAAPAAFCHTPGDVQAFIAAAEEAKAKRAQRKAEREARQAADAAQH